jgi:predicted  nucleic acid-binding Zn-ribbon protein
MEKIEIDFSNEARDFMRELINNKQQQHQLNRVENKLDFIIERMRTLSKEMDDLVLTVTDIGTVTDSAVAAIAGIEAQLAAAGTDPAKLADLAAQLRASKQKLADAIATTNPPTPPTV